MNLPTKSGDYVMPSAVADAYRKVYPSADYEFAQMLIWLETHANRRPASPKSAPRFVANWFKRVPRIAPQRQARLDTLAALTGRSHATDRGHDRPAIRQDGGGLWGAENVVDVEWSRPVGGTAHVGADVIELSPRRLASGG
jgi:hypothetical protein